MIESATVILTVIAVVAIVTLVTLAILVYSLLLKYLRYRRLLAYCNKGMHVLKNRGSTPQSTIERCACGQKDHYTTKKA